jgi:hypothetical protein
MVEGIPKDVIVRSWTRLEYSEDDVAGFLGVLMTPQEDGTIELTQTGLIDLPLAAPFIPIAQTDLPLPPGFTLASSGTQSKLDSSHWKNSCITYRKPSFWLGAMIPAKPTDPKSLTCYPGISSSKATKTKTHHQNPNKLSRSLGLNGHSRCLSSST